MDASEPLGDTAFMQALLDVLVPASDDGRLPGAGSLDLAAGVVSQLESDRLLGPVVAAGLQAVRDAAFGVDPAGLPGLSPDARAALVETQLSAHPALMIGLARHLYPAYYQHPRVLAALGEPARPPFPEGYDLEPTDPDLLQKLQRRQRA